ncbi:MAG: serine--tRNA ligase [bacterium]|nr:serine--tRNA ligase [bacterium]
MLDIKFIRENSDLIKEAARKKHVDFDVAKLLEVDKERLALMTEIEGMRAKQNHASQEIMKASADAKISILHDMKTLKEEMQVKEDALVAVMKSWREMMLAVPNIPDMSVPEGASDAENQEVRVWGDIPKFDFKPKDHIELMQNLGMLDLERGTKVSGFRGYFLKGDGAKLQFALWRFTQDFFAQKDGFVPMIVPALLKPEIFLGTGYLPQGEEDLYKTQDGDYLAGTAEVATMGYYMNDIIEKKDLPLKMLSFSSAFRREAGSHGKDTRGILRVHEFYKFEQVVLCEASHAESMKHHEEIERNTEELTEALGLPYHVVANCGGDLGLGQVKKYDIEVWLPSEGRYRETGSASYFHDFQTRRLNIRYKDDDGKLKFVHSLNNTALSGRPLIAIVENYQNVDGSITVPEVLRKYMGKDLISKI